MTKLGHTNSPIDAIIDLLRHAEPGKIVYIGIVGIIDWLVYRQLPGHPRLTMNVWYGELYRYPVYTLFKSYVCIRDMFAHNAR